MKLIKLTDRRGQIGIINAESIIEISPFESGSCVKLDCRAIGHQNNQSVFIESPDQILAMLSGEPLPTADDNKLVSRAIKGLKYLGPFPRVAGSEPHSMDCTLAGRVSHVFGIGMTSAIQMCRKCGEDPDYQEGQE